MQNLFSDLPASLPEEVTELLLSAENVRIERIVSHGQCSPADFWYDQDEHEWVAVLQGAAKIRIEGEATMRRMLPGDWVLLPAHCRHRVEWTTSEEPTIWLAVFYRVDPE